MRDRPYTYETMELRKRKMCMECGDSDGFHLPGCPARKTNQVWPQDEGRKDDVGKLRYDLIPPEATDALAWILTFGAQKYGDRNWEKGMSWGRVFSALMRHMWSWWRGKNLDPETGKSHLWHAMACLAFLITFEERGKGTDDRSKVELIEDAPRKPD